MNERTSEQIDVIINDRNKERIFIRKMFAIARRYYPFSDVRAVRKLSFRRATTSRRRIKRH